LLKDSQSVRPLKRKMKAKKLPMKMRRVPADWKPKPNLKLPVAEEVVV
jgi:hypothetical protein